MNFKKILHRASAALLSCAILLGMAGCGASTQSNALSGGASPAGNGEASPTGTTGRWVEQKVSFDDSDETKTFYSAPQRMQDGMIFFYASGADDGVVAFRSTDNGMSWTETATDWVMQMQTTPRLVSTSPDGACFIFSYTDAPHYWLKEANSDTLVELDLPDGISYLNCVSFLGNDALLIRGSSTIQTGSGSADAGMDTQGNKLYTVWAICDLYLQQKLAEPDFESGTLAAAEGIFGTALDTSDLALPCLDFLAMTSSSVNLVSVDKTGAAKTLFEGLPSARSTTPGAATDNEGNYYYTTTDGIYRVAKGGSLSELLFDASTFQMGIAGMFCNGLCYCANGDFLVCLMDGNDETCLYRYYWDETLPAAGETQLTVWSLEENQTVRAAIVALASEHPEITVMYQAVTEDDGISKTDAISTLNAQLLAGSGPDILILDGLDYQVYQQKGLLADYADCVDTDAMLQNIVSPFINVDSSITVLPARFSVPLIYSDDSSVAQMDSLNALQTALLACPARPAIDCTDDLYYQERSEAERYGMSFLGVQDLLDFALQTSASEIWDGNTLSAEAIAETLRFVQNVGQYYGMEDYKENPESNGTSTGGTGSDEVLLYDGSYEFSLTGGAYYGRGIMETPAFLGETSRSYGSTGSTVIVQPGLATGAYLPTTLAAINASSQNQEQAKLFLSILFGADVQALYQQDGLPVLTAAWNDIIARNQNYVAQSGYDGDINALIASLKTPELPLDTEIYQALIKAADSLVDGTTTLEEAVTEVQNDLTLYLSEKH